MTISRLVLLLVIIAASREPTHASERGHAAPDEACTGLRGIELAQVQDAPTQLIDAQLIDSDASRGSHCQVSGYVQPNVGFLLRLPAEGWNGKLAQVACGAFCGTTNDQIYAFNCNNPLRKGYACVVSDNGHQSHPLNAMWAYNNLQGEFDHAYRAAHVTALAAKAIIQRYYGEAPKRSYFMGCSNGGRQALVLAQRFPSDFDGLIAGAPELSPPEHFMSLLWASRALTDESGEALLGKSELESVHQAVVEKCDSNDGIRDGLIGDPRACAFDPSELQCGAARTSACLSARQVDAVKKIYQGPMTENGKRIYLPSALPGSERRWNEFVGSNTYSNTILREYFRYSAFHPNAGPTWDPKDFDFDRDYRRQGLAKALHGADNPDLRAFKEAGGKLVLYTGWNDIYVSPLSTVDYFETVERTLGGSKEARDFLRLFVMPGMNHCLGGDGAFAADYLSYLEEWVERGKAPDKLLSLNVKVTDIELKSRTQFPLDPATIGFSRPVYPYPVTVTYSGRGDPNKAESFIPSRARR